MEFDPAEDDPEQCLLISQLRAHISETWRLHRRILRTRRTQCSEVLLPGRIGAEVREWEGSEYGHLEQSLNEWRAVMTQSSANEASSQSLSRLAHVITEAVICDPSILPTLVRKRLGEIADLTKIALFPVEVLCLSEVPLFEGERELLRRLSHITDNIDVTRLFGELASAIEPYMRHPLPQPVSVVVFANYPTTADDFWTTLKKWFGSDRVFRHSSTSTKWTQALNGGTSQILVCDRRAEEELNLQSRRSIIVHCDLPLSANRIEQRMGRLDRFGAGKGIRSIVL